MAISFENYSNDYDVLPDYQTMRGWYGVAITIGIVFVGIGIFGLIGLLQVHEDISLPQKIIAIIKDIDPSSPYLALWSMLFGGASVGALMIGICASGLQEIKVEEQWNQFLEQYFTPLSETSFNAKEFADLQLNTYHRLRNKEGDDAFKIVIRTVNDKLYVSQPFSKTESVQCMEQLNDFNYRDAPSQLIDHFKALSSEMTNFLDIQSERLKKLQNHSLCSISFSGEEHYILIKDHAEKVLVSPPIHPKNLQKWKSFLNSLDQYQEIDFKTLC